MQTLRHAYLMTLLVVFGLLIAGCGPGPEPTPRAQLPASTVAWTTWETSSQAEALWVRKFQELHPQVQFERTSQNAGVESYLSETPPPDLLNMDAGHTLVELSRAGMVADLTELWLESGLSEAVPPAIQRLTAYQDRQFYVPVGFGWKAIYYNKQIFADYNLRPPETWDEFLALCETLLANGEVPLAISGSEAWPIYSWFEYLNLRLNGAEFHRNLLAGKERYDDPRVRRVMETWRMLFDNGYFIEERNALGGLSSMTAIIRGDNGMLGSRRAVMVLGDAYLYGSLPGPFQEEVDFFRFPIMDPNVPVAEVIDPFGYVVPLGAEHLPATLAFLEYVASPEGQTVGAQAAMFQTAHYAPVRGDVDAEQLPAEQRQALALLNEADETVLSFFSVVPREMFGQVYYRFISFVNKPQEIDEFLLKFEEVRQSMVAQGKLTQE